ncbi:MAG TPA: preprotein translocase subunit SecD [Methanocella sp.]|nr:preprotein translocase subunit SecD [Methanocella sp.]
MAEKESGFWTRILTDYRVIALIIFLLLSAILIWPGYSNGQPTSHLKFGLDFEGGSWVRLKLINQTGSNQSITDGQMEQTKNIMNAKLNALGLSDIPIKTQRDSSNNAYMYIQFAGKNISEAMQVLGTQGQFEMRIQSNGNESEHILYGNDVAGQSAAQDPNNQVWGVSIRLTSAGAEKFHEVASKYPIVNDPNNHEIIFLLDGVEFHRAPLDRDLASKLMTSPQSQGFAMTGTGDAGYQKAKLISAQMSAGALPFGVDMAGSGQVSALQGSQFKTVAIIALVLAQLAVGGLMYFRYKEPRIIIPMFLTSLFELFILLGFACNPFVPWEIDMPSMAAIAAVIGTGIDQLIIITDEVMTTGRTPTTKRILQRMTQAFKIIFASAATVIVAMIPLYFLGFGTLSGFALTTIIGVLIGILITRPAYGKIISEIINK